MLDMLTDAGYLVGGLTALAGITALTATGRRVLTAILRYGKAHMSPWMIAVFGVCLLIPGPLDELVVLPILVALTLRTKRNRYIFARYMYVAFNR